MRVRSMRRNSRRVLVNDGVVYSGVRDVSGFWRHPSPNLEGSATESLDPSIWSRLPHDLLELIFASLPIDNIVRLRALSKTWRRAMSTCSTFTTECAKVQPDLGAIMGFSDASKTCWVRVYDTRSTVLPYQDPRKWHAFSIEGIPNMYASSITACDGGLACMVPLNESQPVLVCNPLTREWRQLPLQRLVKYPRIVQLKVDRETETYKVILVGRVSDAGVVAAAEVYDSSTNQYSPLLSGSVMGVWSRTDPVHQPSRAMGFPRVYDCSTGELREYKFPSRAQWEAEGSRSRWRVEGFATCRNDLYLLETELEEEIIVFGRARRSSWSSSIRHAVLKYEEGNWRFGADGSSKFCRRPEMLRFNVDIPGTTKLLVCKTFFMVVRHSSHDYNQYIMKCYNVESNKWQNFDLQCNEYSISRKDMETAFACELRWDARP